MKKKKTLVFFCCPALTLHYLCIRQAAARQSKQAYCARLALSLELKKQLDESTKKVQELLVSIEQWERAQPILVHLIAEYLYNVFCSLLNNSYKNLIEYNKIHTFASQVLAKPLHNAQIERGILYKGCSKNQSDGLYIQQQTWMVLRLSPCILLIIIQERNQLRS